MPGPWEKYAQVQQPSQDQGPWTKYAQQTLQPPQQQQGLLDKVKNVLQPNDTTAQAALEKFGNAASFGYLPQLQAAAQPYTDKAIGLLTGKQAPEDNRTYEQRRDENIKRLEQYGQTNPVASTAGTIGGLIAGGSAISKAMPAAVQALSPTKQAALAGAAQGLIANPGDVEGQQSGPQIKERLEQGALGGALGGLGEKAIQGVAGAAGSLKSLAQEKAFKSSGAMLKDFRKAFARDRVDELGQSMLDNGLVTPGSTFETIADKADALRKEAGQKLGSIYNAIFEKVKQNPEVATNSFATLSPDVVRSQLTAAISDPSVVPRLGRQKYFSDMGNIIDEITSSNQLHDVRYLNDTIGEIDKKIGWSRKLPDMSNQEQGLVRLRQTLRNKINETANLFSDITDKPTADALQALNKQYGNMREISQIANDRVARESANRAFSPSDYGAAGIGALIGAGFGETPEQRVKHAAEGALFGLGNKAFRKYGNPVLATGAEAASRAIAPVSNIAGQINPQVAGAVIGGAAQNLTKKQGAK